MNVNNKKIAAAGSRPAVTIIYPISLFFTLRPPLKSVNGVRFSGNQVIFLEGRLQLSGVIADDEPIADEGDRHAHLFRLFYKLHRRRPVCRDVHGRICNLKIVKELLDLSAPRSGL